jgi:hypothetical protein
LAQFDEIRADLRAGPIPSFVVNPGPVAEHPDADDYICIVIYFGDWPEGEGELCFRDVLLALKIQGRQVVIFPSWVSFFFPPSKGTFLLVLLHYSSCFSLHFFFLHPDPS